MTEKEELVKAKAEAKEAKEEVAKAKAEAEKVKVAAKAEVEKAAKEAKIKIETEKSKRKYQLVARYRGIDKEGDKIKIVNESEGASLQDVLDNFDYPKGMVALVKLTVKKDGNEVCPEIALAPHRARQILEGKDIVVFKKAFGL